jgi:hypothetical protein
MRIIIPSVNYADFLLATLPSWRQALPEAQVTVVTTPGDVATMTVATQHGAQVLETPVWFSRIDGRPTCFNKYRALDEALAFANPAVGEPVLMLDADVVPVGPCPTAVEADTLVGCIRYLVTNVGELSAYLKRPVPGILRRLNPLPNSSYPLAHVPHGYFQLFAYRSGIGFGDFHNAAKGDLRFGDHFKSLHWIPPKEFHVLHLGASSRANWNGRVLPAFT